MLHWDMQSKLPFQQKAVAFNFKRGGTYCNTGRLKVNNQYAIL
jgi:hypothetical protein